MSEPLHPLLLRQLRKTGLALGAGADAVPFTDLMQRVSRAYTDSDQDRYLSQRSQDISSREMAELNDALRISQARLSSLLSLSSDWVWEQDPEGRFTFVSEGLAERTGLTGDRLIGHRCTIAGPIRVSAPELHRLRDCIGAAAPFRDLTFDVVGSEGRVHHMRIHGEPVFDGGRVTGFRGVGSDVSEAVMAERKIHELARYDSLTGLPNRRMFMEELGRTLVRCNRHDREFALFFIDLDRFKAVNDNLGHAAGDLLLRIVSERLRPVLRDADMLARLGGDEFVVLTEAHCSPATLSKVASRIIGTISEPVQIEGRKAQISASIGISVYPADGTTAEAIVRSADAAMYHAKDRGKNTFEFFTADLSERSAENYALEADLRQAVDGGQLVLHFQPQVDALTRHMVGVEALVRWQHPTRGLLLPGLFIDLAEESGMIVPIGRWVLNTACAQIAAWAAEGLSPPRCAVNVSRRQLVDDALIHDVEAALASSGIEPHYLEIEVTESLLMDDPERATAVLERLSRMGVHLAIDDFGVGHSSMSYLKRFPAETLKIDRSFVRDLPGDVDDAAICRAVIAMGHSLGMHIVAEGVETAEQQRMLVDMGCDVLQGYLFGRPVPAETLAVDMRLVQGVSSEVA